MSESAWAELPNPDQLEFGYYVVRGEYRYRENQLLVMGTKDPAAAIDFDHIEPDLSPGNVIYPEMIKFLSVEGYVINEHQTEKHNEVRDFVRNFFREINQSGIATWSKIFLYEGSSVATYSINDIEYYSPPPFIVKDIDDLLDVHYNPEDFTEKDPTRDYFDIEKIISDEIDADGLRSYLANLHVYRPKEIVLSPSKWQDLLQEWVQNYDRYPIEVDHALIRVPAMVAAQGDYLDSDSSMEWVGGGGKLTWFEDFIVENLQQELSYAQDPYLRKRIEGMLKYWQEGL